MVNFVSTTWLDKILPVIIILVALYTLFNRMKESDKEQLPKQNRQLKVKQSTQGFLLGFYDGALGPGTGAFWVISTMRLYKLNILLSSGIAKSMNFVSNFTSLLVFLYFGQVDWIIGLIMGSSLMMGAYIGAHSAIHFGAKFIRPIFILIVMIMALHLGYNAWLS